MFKYSKDIRSIPRMPNFPDLPENAQLPRSPPGMPDIHQLPRSPPGNTRSSLRIPNFPNYTPPLPENIQTYIRNIKLNQNVINK